ncbi:hypothetical protein C0416_02655 [bacterium]|nr:hypothetical protein [bacterium]
MNKKSNKTAYTFVGIAILAIVVLAAGWFYFQSQNATYKVESDQPAYFTVDNPILEVKLLNKKDASSGEIGVKFSEDVLKVKNTETSEGVTLRKLDNEYVFELGDTYFSSNNEVIATLTFESVKPGQVNFELDEELSTLSNSKGVMEVKYESTSVEVGMAPDREENRESQGETGEFNSL